MAGQGINNATYKIYTGNTTNSPDGWETFHFQTCAPQVVESTNRRFLNPSVHTVNGLSFFDSSNNAKGITLYADNIKIDSTSSGTVGTVLTNINQKAESASKTASDLSTTVNTLSETVGTLEAGIDGLSSDVDGLALNVSAKQAKTMSKRVTVGGKFTTDVETAFGIIADFCNELPERGVANGVASLDGNGKVPSSQLPSYVDDVLEYGSMASFPDTGESSKIYIDLDTNKTYRWGGSQYVEISSSLALGNTATTAWAGDKGQTNATNIATLQGYFTGGIANNAKKDDNGNIISATYQSKKLDDWIVVYGNTTNADTVVGVLNNLATFCNGISGTYATKNEVKDVIDNAHKIFTGLATPTGMKQGDIWLEY